MTKKEDTVIKGIASPYYKGIELTLFSRSLTLALVLFWAGTSFSQAFSWGYANTETTKTIDVFLLAIKTNPDKCGDCDGMTWQGLSTSYEMESKRAALLYSMGMLSIAQVYAGAGPELRLSDFQEMGIKFKGMLGLMVCPLTLGITPNFNFETMKPGIRFEAGWGLGFITPIFGNPTIWKGK